MSETGNIVLLTMFLGYIKLNIENIGIIFPIYSIFVAKINYFCINKKYNSDDKTGNRQFYTIKKVCFVHESGRSGRADRHHNQDHLPG